MRKFTLAVLMMIAAGIHPLLAGNLSTLHLRMQDNSPFMIVLDGKQFGPMGTYHTIEGITPGNHDLQVLEDVLTMNNTPVRTSLYNGNVYFQTPVEVEAMIDYYGQFTVLKQRNIFSSSTPYINNYYNGYNQPGYTQQCNQNNHEGYYGDPYHAGNTYYNTENTYYNAPCAMDNASFSALKRTVSNQWFDDTKETIVKGAMLKNKFTSQQVKELVSLFTFESTKLEIAKSAYNFVVDKQNFFTVFDCFSFASSVDELNQFIAYQ